MGKFIISEMEKCRIKGLYEQKIGPVPNPDYKPGFKIFDFSKIYGGATNISKEGLDLIKNYEGFRELPYKCSAGKDTIGYGTRLDYYPECKGKKFTEQEATKYLIKTVNDHIVPVIKKHVKVPLNQNQINALISLLYNIGEDNFVKSNLLKDINKGDEEGIKKNWSEFRLADGKVSPGLVKRRTEEIQLFFK